MNGFLVKSVLESPEICIGYVLSTNLQLRLIWRWYLCLFTEVIPMLYLAKKGDIWWLIIHKATRHRNLILILSELIVQKLLYLSHGLWCMWGTFLIEFFHDLLQMVIDFELFLFDLARMELIIIGDIHLLYNLN